MLVLTFQLENDVRYKPTIVLVHGAFADSSSWNGVVEILEKDGFTVVTAANPLRGVRSDGDDIAGVLSSIKARSFSSAIPMAGR
jgi:hypothetical protein